MSKPKFDSDVYVALRGQGLNNQQIADKLGVSEASVRRGLNKAGYKPWLLPPEFIDEVDFRLEKPVRLDVAKLGGISVTSDWHHPVINRLCLLLLPFVVTPKTN